MTNQNMQTQEIIDQLQNKHAVQKLAIEDLQKQVERKLEEIRATNLNK